jgi:hypothetical protein
MVEPGPSKNSRRDLSAAVICTFNKRCDKLHKADSLSRCSESVIRLHQSGDLAQGSPDKAEVPLYGAALDP